MIHLVARRIRPTNPTTSLWPRKADGPRHNEAIESLAAEGVTHETAMLIDTSNGPGTACATETDDLVHSKSANNQSPRSIHAEHRAAMRAADDGPANAEVVLDLRPD